MHIPKWNIRMYIYICIHILHIYMYIYIYVCICYIHGDIYIYNMMYVYQSKHLSHTQPEPGHQKITTINKSTWYFTNPLPWILPSPTVAEKQYGLVIDAKMKF